MCITARFLPSFCSSESSRQKELLFDQHFVVVSKATYEEHMSILLGGLITFLAWWPSNNVPAMVAAAAAAGSLYFVSQSTAILYPNTAYFDPEFSPTVGSLTR